MTSKLEKTRGCWTCRARRKKCHGENPCRDCKTLGIDCCFQTNKPEWMDHGPNQLRKVEEIKAQIKQNAKQRRTQQKLQTLTQRLRDGQASRVADQAETDQVHLSAESSKSGDTISRSYSHELDVSPDKYSSTSPVETPSISHDCNSHQVAQSTDVLDHVMLMAFLDYLFPVMYPFYRTSMTEGGRAWILHTILSNTCLRHSILALSSQQLAQVQEKPGSSIQLCDALDTGLLHQQTQAALQTAQASLQAVRSKGSNITVFDSSQMLSTIVQLMTVELPLGTNNWTLHLDAATSLFQQMLHSTHSSNNPADAFAAIIRELDSGAIIRGTDPPLLMPTQACFRFYATKLIFSDCIAGTSLEQEPRLHQYSSELLRTDVNLAQFVQINVAEVFGVQNETLLLISATASLAAWKKAEEERQRLCVAELVRRASELEVRLEKHIHDLETSVSEPKYRRSIPLDLLAGRSPVSKHTASTVSRIWALATKSYLFVTASGLQLHHSSLQTSISQTISLLETLANKDDAQVPAWLRALSWPICVTGLLVTSSIEKHSLKKLFHIMEPCTALGTVPRLRDIIERAWHRAEMCDQYDPFQRSTLGTHMRRTLFI
ncbi:hypothetical protein B0A52_06379 [Exophiala mesophila]|uniref:Zn(2)-C6 fungal-type domain-containing protein n=1 Tax=Exophiala mesophila TaxID=212818 RepID=A0A438N266_EXOME|nr:hypothetical protein B0A52_06379 [Exophiala mesophila]